jgi:adenylate kinase family enzyme
MPKIMIFGAAGSGATTLAKEISEIFKIPHFDSDDYFWVKSDPPYITKLSLPERQSNLKTDLESKNEWILSGSIHSWAPFVADMLTHAIYLYIPEEIRMQRLLAREESRFGNRIKNGGDMYDVHQSFMKWAAGYEVNSEISRTKSKDLAWANSLQCAFLKIENNQDINVIVNNAINWIHKPS